MLRCGIDEAGYGPKLGPLVVAVTAVRRGLSPSPCPVPVADSKRLFSPARGVGVLERTVLAFAGQSVPIDGLTYGAFRTAAAGALPRLPWYGDFPLPWKDTSVPVDDVRRWLGGRTFSFAARVVEPEGLNRVGNKADLLFAQTADLVREMLARFPGEPAEFRIGKQGGRRVYRRLLAESFGALPRVEREERDRSTYTLSLGGRSVRFDFLRDGEDRDFLLALSSMFAKYLREGAMRLFNEYWAARIAGLARTSGYGTDGGRFFREIETELKRLRLPAALVLRER